jgi:hypothetical protein
MKRILPILASLMVLAPGCQKVAVESEADAITEYMSTYRDLGVSDSLLLALEKNMLQGSQSRSRGMEWMTEHVRIIKRIALEQRLRGLDSLRQTGSEEERKAAEDKIKEIAKGR